MSVNTSVISTQQKWYLLIFTGRIFVLGKLVHSVSVNPVFFPIKLLRSLMVCEEVDVTPHLDTLLGKLAMNYVVFFIAFLWIIHI